MNLQVLLLWFMLKVPFCVFASNCLTLTFFPPIGRVLVVPEAAIVQLEDSKAHYESPSYSDRGKKYMNQHTANTSKLPLISESSNSENRTRIEVPSDASVSQENFVFPSGLSKARPNITPKAHYESPMYSDRQKKYMNQRIANTSKLPFDL